MVSVIDYGVANIGSLMNMLDRVGVPARRVSKPEEVRRADKLVLPGVGSFDNGMAHLRTAGLDRAIVAAVKDISIPILGICLGMQLLGVGSEEGTTAGLGLLDARCIRFSLPPGSGLKVPHQGWASLPDACECSLIQGEDRRRRFYFSHSFHLVCSDPTDVCATARYGIEFTAVVEREHIYGTQFHPEKSHLYGMDVLQRYGSL